MSQAPPQPSVAALPDVEVDRVIELLDKAVGNVHPDLRSVLAEPDADSLADEFFRDEVHDQRT